MDLIRPIRIVKTVVINRSPSVIALKIYPPYVKMVALPHHYWKNVFLIFV